MPSRNTLMCLLPAAAALLAAAPALAVDPTVILTTSAQQPTLSPGQSTTITVSAQVSNTVATNGIIAFDLDLYPLIKSGVHFTSLALLDPTATFVSAGTADPATGGVLGITGLYSGNGKGVTSPVNLFTIQLMADAAGPNSISAGLSVYPNGTGIPFQLKTSGDYVDPSSGTPPFLVNSSSAIANITVAVPEPSTALLTLTLLTPALLKRRRRA